MTEIYQIPDSVGVPPSLNADLANIQKQAELQGPKNAFAEAYTQIVASFGGDPFAGTVIPGTTLAINASTQVQRLIFQAWQIGNTIPANAGDVLAANPGPTGPGNEWNWSYGSWGLDPTIAADPSISTRTVLTANGSSVASTTGILAPQ